MLQKFVYLILFISLALKNGCSDVKSSKEYQIEYYSDGTKKAEGPIKNVLKSGVWKFFYPDGKIRNVSHFIKGKKNGTSIQYFENGGIADSLNYKDGRFYGVVKFYYPNGRLNHEDYYDENGLNQGVFKLWYPSGKLMQMGVSKDGKIIGKSLEYYENGKIDHIAHYDLFGNRDSVWTYYSPSGIIIKKEFYDRDSLISHPRARMPRKGQKRWSSRAPLIGINHASPPLPA